MARSAPRKKTVLPRYDERRGWIGGDNRALYAFVDRRTGSVHVYPGGGAGKKLLMNMGPEANVRLASRSEAESLWQSPLHAGWRVSDHGAGHATKKLPIRKKTTAQLDREIDDVLSDSFTVGNGQYRVHVSPDRYRGGYSAKLISVGIGTIMEPNAASPRQALATLLRELRSEGSHDLAREIAVKGWSPGR